MADHQTYVPEVHNQCYVKLQINGSGNLGKKVYWYLHLILKFSCKLLLAVLFNIF